VAASTDREGIEIFLARWPHGQHADAAHLRIAELRRGSQEMPYALLSAGLLFAFIGLIVFGWGYQQKSISLSVLTTQAEGALKPKDVFKECDKCPEMVVVPSGSFTMGSPDNDKERYDSEGPQH
jgi:formylglycine-generating enzyme required for sulfatase activity